MKKLYLGLLLLGSTSLLAACGGTSGDEYVIKEGDAVVTEQLMQANYNENVFATKKVTFQNVELKDLEGYTLETNNYNYGYGVYSKDGKYGIYSYFAQKFIVDARLTTEPLDSDFSYDHQFGFSFIYKEPSNNHYYIADGAGNVLAESKVGFANLSYMYAKYMLNYEPVADEYNNVTLYSTLMYIDADPEGSQDVQLVVHKYDANNVASKSSYAEISGRSEKAGDYPENLYEYDFKEEGIELKVRVYGQMEIGYHFEVYDYQGEQKATFMVEAGTNGAQYFLAGKRIYLQSINILDGRIIVNQRYFDLESLKEKSYDASAIISSIRKLQSVENNEHTYFSVSLQEVKSDGTYGMARVMIMDEKGDFHDDITHKNFVSWLRLSNGYFYNQSDKELYDAEFKFVASVRYFSFNETEETFYQLVNNVSYAVLNNEGKYVFDAGKYGLENQNAIINKVFKANDQLTGDEGYFDMNTGKFFELENTKATDPGKVAVTETVESSNYIIRVEKTYSDEARTSEETAKRKGSIRTLDGQVLFEAAEKFDAAAIGAHYSRSVGVKTDYFATVYTSVDSKATIYLAYTNLLAAKAIEAPAAA